MFYFTSCDAKTVRRTSWRLGNSDRYFHQEHFATDQPTVLMGDMSRTQTRTHTHNPKVKSVVTQIPSGLN